MRDSQLKRVLDLIRRTGMGMVIMDEGSDQSYVLMPFEEFEAQLGFQRDIGVVETPDHEEKDAEEAKDADIWDVMQGAGEKGETWDVQNMSSEELAGLEQQFSEFAARHVEEAINDIESEQPEKMDDQDFGEEQFYLEPID